MSVMIASSAETETQFTTCPYCGVGCGVQAEVQDGQVVAVKGRSDHPANEGRLCVKGSSLHETVSLDGRLVAPSIHGEVSTWDSALDHVATKFRQVINEHGPDAVAFYLSGQLLTEDYYVANKLIKGFIGTANIDTNSRLCMASAVVAHKRAFGADSVPGSYDDMEQTDVLFFVGSNPAYAHPIVFQRVVQAKKTRDFKIVVVDPRRTATCEIADLHLPLRPGTDAYFYNGLLAYLARHNHLDESFIAEHTEGFEATLEAANTQLPSLEAVAEYCDLPVEDIETAYQWFAENERAVTVFSQGINQSSTGVDKGNAIINCHLATGKIGKVGATPFSITGQPNAMGGREVGGLANQLAAHMTFKEDDVDCVERFWQAPNMARKEGLKAVDMFEAMRDGKIKAVWIMATNPVVSMPKADRVAEALEACDFVVVSECVENSDTAQYADVLLPASTWGEKQGMVTNSERCISLQKGVMPPPGQARHDWQIMCDFAERMGWGEAFDYAHQVDIFSEHARLSAFENSGEGTFAHRAFNIAGLQNLDRDTYENFTPVHWPVKTAGEVGPRRLFADGQFYTPSGRAKFIQIAAEMPRKAAGKDEFIMNTGRVRDQWHTMTRTGKSAKLLTHVAEPYVQIHPADAQAHGIYEDGLIELSNDGSRFVGRAKLSEDQRRGEVFVPMHWNRAFSSLGRADALVNAFTDRLSGQPEFKQSPVALKAYPMAWHGVLVSNKPFSPTSDYWAKITLNNGTAYTMADSSNSGEWEPWLKEQFKEVVDWVGLQDDASGSTRFLGFENDQLTVALFVQPGKQQAVSYQWIGSQLGQQFNDGERFTLLAGTAGDDSLSPGAIVCSCFQIGENQIAAAIVEGCDSSEALGKTLKCGTNCGSCIPELDALVEATKVSSQQQEALA